MFVLVKPNFFKVKKWEIKFITQVFESALINYSINIMFN